MSDLFKDFECNKMYYQKLSEESRDSNYVGSWGGTNQDFRYKELVIPEIFRDASILEIGCGLGGFLEYLESQKLIKPGQYCGIDIVKQMEQANSIKWPQHKFRTLDVLNEEFDEEYDVVVLCGVFNMNTPNSREYMEKLLKASFDHCKKMLSFNFISSYVNYRDTEMAYHNPMEVFSFCIENLSRKVIVNHHYSKCDVSCKVMR